MEADLQDHIPRLLDAAKGPSRYLLGIAGPPGSGKSTCATSLCRRINACASATVQAAVVALDGFHLTHAVLAERDLREVKGSPATFDRAGFCALLSQLRAADADVLAPVYSRELHEPVAEGTPISSEMKLIIVEGNYLLLDQNGWGQVHGLLDETWYLDVPEEICMARVRSRHITGGSSAELADAKIARNDRPNFRLVRGTRHRADLMITP